MKKIILNDSVLSDLDGSLFITKSERNNICLVFLPSWAYKMSFPFLGVCRVGFHICMSAICCMKQRAKWGETTYFSVEETPPFNAKSTFHSN